VEKDDAFRAGREVRRARGQGSSAAQRSEIIPGRISELPASERMKERRFI